MSKNSSDAKPEPLGHFEQLVLSAVTSLRGNAYGVTIHAKVSELAGRSVNLGSIYVTLDRLQDKRLVTSWFGAPTPERGGKPKRYYRLEEAGVLAVRQYAETARRMSETVFDALKAGKWKVRRAR
jgi:DNA-binding PadR family transcriptional regulator